MTPEEYEKAWSAHFEASTFKALMSGEGLVYKARELTRIERFRNWVARILVLWANRISHNETFVEWEDKD